MPDDLSLSKKSIPQNWDGAIMNIYHESDVRAAVLKLKDEIQNKFNEYNGYGDAFGSETFIDMVNKIFGSQLTSERSEE